MRSLLAQRDFTGYAGQFVWLALDFDNPNNADFLAKHGTLYTPTFYIVDAARDRALAEQDGAMTVPEVIAFLERGKHGMTAQPSALADGDALVASNRREDAVAAYERALVGSEHPQAVAALAQTLMLLQRWAPCADLVVAEAPKQPRDASFGRVVLAGMTCANEGKPAALAVLEPLAHEAIALPATALDHRWGLYNALIDAANARHDTAEVKRLGQAWLADIATHTPANDDDREAFDIARTEAADAMDDPAAALPALEASARAHPDAPITAVRLAQLALAAKRYTDVLSSCGRALPHAKGPIVQAWLLRLEGDALAATGRADAARAAYDAGLGAAAHIGLAATRDRVTAQLTKRRGDVH